MTSFKPTKLPIWEKTKQEKRKKKIITYVVLTVFLIMAVNIGIKLPGIYKDLNTPFQNIQKDKTYLESLNTEYRTNILLVSYKDKILTDLAVVSYEPGDKKLSALFFNLPKYKNLSVLLNRSFRSSGVEGLEKRIKLELGLPIDRYLAIDGGGSEFSYEVVAKVINEIKNPRVFWDVLTMKGRLNNFVRSNLSTGEMFKIGFIIRGGEYEEANNYTFGEKDVKNLTDPVITELVRTKFFDRKILQEGAAVTIQNSSGETGVGVNLANFIAGLGATIVTIESSEEIVEQGSVIIKKEKPEFLGRLKSLYRFKEEKAKSEADFSGDVLIIIGKKEAPGLTLE